MDSWIFQRGFPLLSVSVDEAGKLTLTQQRFSYTPLNDDDSVWSVPVTVRYGHERADRRTPRAAGIGLAANRLRASR